MRRLDVWIVLFAGSVVAFASWIRISWAGWKTAPIEPGSAVFARRADDAAASRAAFLEAYKVLMHPRCMNCHPAGDRPLQGDDSHLHAQNVQRGTDGKGKYALKCANCHQLANLPGANMPPGNPNWHLPPPEMKMVFQGKTPRELARQLKDWNQNGHKKLGEILHHVAEDTLVLAGWNPGDGRTKPPLSHDEFVQKMREWIEKGAVEPE
jgi:mono/diheme cytochrome c family protein